MFKHKANFRFLNSLHGRYLAIVSILMLIILSSAGMAQYYLSRTEAQSHVNIKVRNQVIEYSQQIRNAIRQAEDTQSAFLLTPLSEYKYDLNIYFETALYHTSALKKISWIQRIKLEQEIDQLHSNINLLKQASDELAEIRSQPERLFPSSRVLQKVMSIDNQDFYTAASLSLSEISATDMYQTHIETYRLFESCQHQWVQMISSFRLYLLNLTGILGTPASGLQAYTNNTKIRYQQIQHQLNLLDKKDQRGELGLQSSQSLADMKRTSSNWWETYQKMQSTHKSAEWRADIPFTKKTIKPLYDEIWDHLLLLDQHLERSFADDLSSLTHVARISTHTLWGFVVLVLLAISSGYYILKKKILYPISTVTRVLQSENWGAEIETDDPGIENLPSAQLDETRQLIQAFTDTSHKIRERQNQLEYQATHDSLTSLPNRVQLTRHIKSEIARTRSRKLSVALLLLDLDRFKEINDTLGHQLGDRVLQEVSTRLLACLRQSDFVARLGGDEFALLLSGVTLDFAEEVALRIVKSLQQPLEINSFQLHVGGSIGIALCPLHGDDPDTLIRCADVAMYESKRRSNGYMIYDPARDPNSVNRLTLVSDFHTALKKDELQLYYQPKINIKSGEVIGIEALLRWQHPEHGFIPPDELIPMAEQTGVINDLTRWVLKTALQQCALWFQQGHELNIAVNLSTWDLQDPQLANYIKNLLEDHNLSSQHLLLEVTETAMMADPERAIETMNQLAEMKIELSVDDFGTGFSSLSYLKKLPINELKIDKSFVIDMCKNDHDAVLVRSIIELSHNLGLTVVAEGVEDQEIWDLLEILNCDKLQGYFISRPMASDLFEDWLLNWKVYPTLTRYRARQSN